MVGFILRAVYGTLVTPSLAAKWDEAEDGMCKLCRTERGTLQHILSGCKVALEQGRYTWRHDKVLNQIQSQVAYHLDKRVNNPKRSVSLQSSTIEYWVRKCWSKEERISAAHELKLDRYSGLQVECQENGWSCYNMAVEVGARGVVAESLIKAAAAIGMRGRARKKLVRDVGMEACHCSKWLYWLCGKKEWERRDIEMSIFFSHNVRSKPRVLGYTEHDQDTNQDKFGSCHKVTKKKVREELTGTPGR
ncbi:hypothetical protein ACHWQZ_G000901 [Mnemiopsis leidyi]